MEIRVLITGSNGQLGKAIVKTFKTNDNIRVIGIDITDEDKSSCDECWRLQVFGFSAGRRAADLDCLAHPVMAVAGYVRSLRRLI